MHRQLGRLVQSCLRTLVLAGLLTPMVATGQSETAGSPGAPATAVQTLEQTRQKIESDTSIPEETRTRALALYEQATTAAAQAERIHEENRALESRISAAPARIAELREELENPPRPEQLPTDASVETLQALANQKRAEYLAAREAVDRQSARKRELVQASSTLLARYVERERSLLRLDEEIAATPSDSQPPVLRQARRDLLTARRSLEEAMRDAQRLLTFNYDVLVELATREHDAALARFTPIEEQVRALDRLLQEEREEEARAQRARAAETVKTTMELPQGIVAIALETEELKAEIASVIERETFLNNSIRREGELLRELYESFSRIRERVTTYGASQAIGRLLQRRLNLLPSTAEYEQRERSRDREVAEIINRRIDVEDQRRALSQTDIRVREIVDSLPAEEVGPDRRMLEEQVAELLKSNRDALTGLHDAYSRYMTRLMALKTMEQEIVNLVRQLGEFIRKQLLWTPTLPPLSAGDLAAAPAGLAWLLSPFNWGPALAEAGRSFLYEPILASASLLLIVLIFWIRHRARYRLSELAQRSRGIESDAFTSTIKAVGYTAAAAIALPAVLAFLAHLLAAEPTPDEAFYSRAVAGALEDIVVLVYVLTLIRWLTRPDGLGPGHFRWSADVCERVRAGIVWLAWLVVPAAFVTNIAKQSVELEYILGLGRPALIIAFLATAVFIWYVFNRRGAFDEYLRDHEESWKARLWFVWFPILLAIPLSLCVLSGLGYQVAAGTLGYLIFGETVALLIALFLLNDLLIRWFNVTERRSRLNALRRQREEARLDRAQEESEGVSGFEVEVPEVDYHGLGQQARSVIRVGVFLGLILSVGSIWADLVPTLGLMERIELPFSKVQMVDGVEKQLPVNLADILIGLLILGGTLFAAKNLPGLMEFTLLRRLRFDAGGNYAIVTLSQYTLVAIGVMVALSTIGLQWSKIQWLIAALGVGLGFGLQEIVANFVSGIILLLERPVRIGDIVSVGNADGYISRIRIRATTILTWEKKELIIPNKEFITGQVLNWTLTDSLTRILFNVGIAYGSDVRKARELMKEAAVENEIVLADPEPVVTFEAFGNDALMLYLRCHIASPDNRLRTVTDLHQAIYDKFRDAGIVIAFPQRDVHLDTSKPLEINLTRSPTPKSSS